jgi:hypothetical protein
MSVTIPTGMPPEYKQNLHISYCICINYQQFYIDRQCLNVIKIPGDFSFPAHLENYS